MTNEGMRDDGANRQLIPLLEFQGEPLVRDVDIGEKLGLARPTNVRTLIERNRAEIEGFGSLHHGDAMIVAGKGAEREGREYWLNEEQALLVATLSRAPRASEVRSPADDAMMNAAIEDKVGRIIAHMVPALVEAEVVKCQFGTTRDHVTAGQALDIAKVASKGRKGLVVKTSNALRRFCYSKSIVPREAVLGATHAYVFPIGVVREWLQTEGEAMIRTYLSARAGQTVFPFKIA